MTPHPTNSERNDVLEFGGPGGPRRMWRAIAIVIVVALGVALGLYGSLRGSHTAPPTTRAQSAPPTAASVGENPAQPAPGLLMRAAGPLAWGYNWPPQRFWYAFSVVAPNITLRSVTASLDPLVGATDVGVRLYSGEDAKRYAFSGDFPSDTTARVLTAGAQLAAVIVMTPICAALPLHQPITIHVRYASPSGPGQLDVTDTPDLLLDDITTAGACSIGSGH